MKDFLISSDVKYNLYAVYLIKQFFRENESNKKLVEAFINQINKEYLLILTSLLNKSNKKLYYDILYCLISISFIRDDIFAQDEKILLIIANFLGKNKNENNLLFHGIWLIRNTTLNGQVCEILLKYKIVDFFDEIYERHLLDDNFMKYIMICILNIINYKKKKTEKEKINCDYLCLLPVIKIIKTQIRPNLDSTLLYKYFISLFNLTGFFCSEIYYEMTKVRLHKELMNIYPYIIQNIEDLNNKIKNLNNEYTINDGDEKQRLEEYKKSLDNYKCMTYIILKIFARLLSLEDAFLTQIMIDSGISKFLTQALKSSDIKLIKNITFAISNICASECGQLVDLYENNTLVELINVSKNIYEALEYNEKIKTEEYNMLKDAFRELNFAFSLAINNSIYERSIPLARYNNNIVVLILIKGLKLYYEKYNEDLLTLILESLFKLLIFDNTSNGNEGNFDNNLSFKEIIERQGVKEYLEIIMNQKNTSNVKWAKRVYDLIFNDFEDEVENNL